ncbi:MAG TPA: protein YgfX [Burkholderiales bacterium]
MSAAARLELRPSPALAAAIMVGHAAAAAAAYMVVPGVMGAALAAALFALGVAAAWSRALLRSSGAVRAMEIGGPQPVFELANGASFAADVAARRYVTRYVVALPLGRPLSRTLLVTADMLGAQEFRRLRIWALWNRLPRVAAKQLPV